MLDLTAAQLALRNRAISLVVCSTGSTSLSATTTGYARSTGSFVTDGFRIGMEVTPSGFTQTTPCVIESVSALALGITGGRTVQAEGSGRSLTVGFPALRALDNVDFTPTPGRPYIEEDFVPAGPPQLITFPAQGGQLEESGLYVIKWYGLSGKGISAIRKSTDALKALFTAGTVLTVGSAKVRVPADTGAYAGQILPQGDGFSVCTVTVPWSARSINAVAA